MCVLCTGTLRGGCRPLLLPPPSTPPAQAWSTGVPGGRLLRDACVALSPGCMSSGARGWGPEAGLPLESFPRGTQWDPPPRGAVSAPAPAVGGTDCMTLLGSSSCVVCGKLESLHVLKMPQLPKSVLLWARVPRVVQTGWVLGGVSRPQGGSWRVGSLSVCLWGQRSLSTSPDTPERCRDPKEGSCLGPCRGLSGRQLTGD